MKKLSVGISAVAITLMSAQTLHADDTEVYVSGGNVVASSKPQVLIILDNSGSMTNNSLQVPVSYDPDTDYLAPINASSYANHIFLVNASDETPDSYTEVLQQKNILNTYNGCNSADEAINSLGKFTTKLKFPSSAGESGKMNWYGLGNANWENGTTIVECYADLLAANPGVSSNATEVPTGFPEQGESTGYDGSTASMSQAELETARDASLQVVNFNSESGYTMYSANYLAWYVQSNGGQDTVSKTRMQVAKDTIAKLVRTTSGVDFGLAVFNYNHGSSYAGEHPRGNNGGRIIAGIKEMDEAGRTSFIETVDGLVGQGNTPLCETMFEAYRYFSGGGIYSNGYSETPNVDSTILNSANNYISPLGECQAQAYVVLISDGAPTSDTSYNTIIQTELSADAEDAYGSNYLPAVAKYMYENDMAAVPNGNQRVITYTVGFSEGASSAAPILTQTANNGGGAYYTALDSDGLSETLTQIFAEILADNSTFTSPSVAASASDRTSTRDAVYYGMFLPSDSPRWSGNLKKLKINSNGEVVDARGARAIDANGNIDNGACTVWTDTNTCSAADGGGDGNQVEVGGVVEQLLTQSTRNIKMIGSGNAIEALTKTNLTSLKTNEAGLRTALGITSDDDLDEYVNWLRGIDVDDEDEDDSTTDTRPSVFGDPLHSKPLALSYAEGSSADVRLLVGTNQGYLHMFKDSGNTVSESWALFLPELLGNVKELRDNEVTGGHTVYGVDSSPVAYINDANYNGEIDNGDTAIVYFGMRRGGSSYYAIDVTNPDNPVFKWTINNTTTNFENLGQSWSEPVITKINGYSGPVVIFSGGYDVSKDVSAVGTADNEGNSIYIVDALTGSLVHRFEGTVTNGTNTALAATDSMPNKVAILDSDADGYTDRLYATDTGGNVWRIDMPGTDRTKWSSYKFAELGGDTLANDRRFFAEVSVAQTSFEHKYEIGSGENRMVVGQEVPYDAVAIGSGNRSHPNSTGTNDYLFVLQDRKVNTQVWNTDNPHPDAITVSNLYSVDGDPFNNIADAEDQLTKELELGEKLGWYYSLVTQEKSLAAPLIVAGQVYFTTYTPGDLSSSNSCVVSGNGKLYGFNLQYGKSTAILTVSSHIPDSPQLLVPPMASDAGNEWSPSLSLVGIGPGQDGSGTLDTGQMLVPSRIYYQYGGE